MIILGKNNYDKGTQLEVLTRMILSELGYQNIILNLVGSGGEEIDVTADFPIPSIGGKSTGRFICECKAYSRPVDMPHWLKFLGKLYAEEARLSTNVSGCFIALSGVTGNVSGHFEHLKLHSPRVTLVDGESLSNEIKSVFNLVDVERVKEILTHFTTRAYKTLELAYYDNEVYWVITFEDNAYTLIRGDGQLIDTNLSAVLAEMLKGVLSARPFIGLKEEEEAQRRGRQAKKAILGQLIVKNGHLERTNLDETAQFQFETAEFDQAIDNLIGDGEIVVNSSGREISFNLHNTTLSKRLASIFLFILGGEPVPNLLDVINSEFYLSQIDESLIDAVLQIQGNLPLEPSDVQDAIKFLRWSPSAVLWAVQPDPMISTHRNDKTFKGDESIDVFDRDYFFSQLHRSLSVDMQNPFTRARLIDTFNIREVETKRKISVKSSTGVEHSSDLNERVGIAHLADTLKGPDGSSTVVVLMLDSAPQPWEPPSSENESDNESQKDLT